MSNLPPVVLQPAVQPPSQPAQYFTADQVRTMIEQEVTKALASQPKGITWAQIRGNKYFVLATSSLAGALGEQIFEAVKNHTFAWNSHSLGAMLSVAAGTAATAVYHLYTQPNPPTATKD